MRRNTTIAIVGVCVVIIGLATWGLFAWAPWSSVKDGQLKTGIESYKGNEYADPPTPESVSVDEALSPQEATSALTTEQIAGYWQAVQAAATENNWQAWGLVVDANTGTELFSSNSTAGHTPASTAKILTALTALNQLDSQSTLKTGVSVASGENPGDDIYLWGEGDLLLTTGKASNETSGHASLQVLAEKTAIALKETGKTSVAVKYQDTLFNGDKRHPAWAEQGVTDYAGDVGPYAIDTGRTSDGAWDFVDDSSSQVANAFAGLLEEQGITVTGTSTGTAPAESTPIATVESDTVNNQITYMLQTSDNTMAEQYCHLAAAKSGSETTFAGATTNVISTVGSLGVNTDGLKLDDCSGLSENSKVSASQLVEALQASATTDSHAKALLRILPRAGINGTMADRMTDDQSWGNVQAKTGSLGKASTLSGIVTTASGQTLLFAVGYDEVPDSGAYYGRLYIDQFLSELANS